MPMNLNLVSKIFQKTLNKIYKLNLNRLEFDFFIYVIMSNYNTKQILIVETRKYE